MSNKNVKKTSAAPRVIIVLMVLMIGAALYFMKVVLSGESTKKQNPFATVTLLKPPPPPPVKEKPPEPEEVQQTQKKEEVFTPEQINVANQDSRQAGPEDNTPAGDNLGVDAEGAAGSDAFGLVGKKGGRSLLSGGGGAVGGIGKMSLLTKFSGYTHIAESEIRKRVLKRLDEGGTPRGKLQVIARVSLDKNGAVVGFKIIGSSGNSRMDEAIKEALNDFKISQPPPDGMPQKMDIKFSYQG